MFERRMNKNITVFYYSIARDITTDIDERARVVRFKMDNAFKISRQAEVISKERGRGSFWRLASGYDDGTSTFSFLYMTVGFFTMLCYIPAFDWGTQEWSKE